MKNNDIVSSDPNIQQALSRLGLTHFDAWWELAIDWLEPPNLERGGWSGVGRYNIESIGDVYVKRQKNHCRRTFRHPLNGVPTFLTEFKSIQALQKLGVIVPQVVFFGCQKSGKDQQAVFVTLALGDYVSLESINPKGLDASQQDQLAKQIGNTLRHLHVVGWQHRAMYPKHLFVKLVDGKIVDHSQEQCALIDLEKSRVMLGATWQRYTDLIPLFHRLRSWPPSFLKSIYVYYCGQAHLNQADLNIVQRLGWCWILRHLQKRLSR